MLYNKTYLRKNISLSRKFSSSFNKKIDVYWNNEFDNYVIYVNGKYFTEFVRGQTHINIEELKKKFHKARFDGQKEDNSRVEKQINRNKFNLERARELRKKDFFRAVDNKKRHRVMVY